MLLLYAIFSFYSSLLCLGIVLGLMTVNTNSTSIALYNPWNMMEHDSPLAQSGSYFTHRMLNGKGCTVILSKVSKSRWRSYQTPLKSSTFDWPNLQNKSACSDLESHIYVYGQGHKSCMKTILIPSLYDFTLRVLL